ncbi:MAG: molybdopterin-guanine dinucleotide biosynthesis protein B [Mogibacterium sp.]|nr:molybdopterin-guanine dinucleotide biosynthesis protein B [Mogibacterium sp.]
MDSYQTKDPVITAVCGIKNSGKTTLINRMVSRLAEWGYRVAVIKHDGHDFDCDVPGTDSHSYIESGAYGTAVFSANRMFVHRTGTGETEEELIRLFPDADIILLEGLKEKPYRKIEIVRSGISEHPASNPEGRILIVSDLPESGFDEPVLPPEDLDGILSVLLQDSDL